MTRAMLRLSAFIAAVATVSATLEKGIVEVEEVGLPHLLRSFDVLLKIDKGHPYGENQEAFKDLAEAHEEQLSKPGRIRSDFLFAKMSVQNYGDIQNQDFAKKLGAADENTYPEYFYMKKGQDPETAVRYTGEDKGFDAISVFIKEQAGIRVAETLLPEMDAVAAKFVYADDDKTRQGLAEEASTVAKSLPEESDRTLAELYIKVMSKALDKGMDYFTSESNRLKRMLGNGKMKKDKQGAFEEKLKVLASFTNPISSDEL
mmetsp:Transcript_7705/g.12799  ORF Transcript_7705/g.12799 Transcript_7705/m.12799 type:complete len:260 (-) Transcript_7705:155-934(-)